MKKKISLVFLAIGIVAISAMIVVGTVGLSTTLRSIDQRVEQNAKSTSTEIDSLRLEVSILRSQIPDAVQYINMGKAIATAAKGKMTPGQIAEISRIIFNRCNLNQDIGIEPAMVVALIEQESSFNPRAVSNAGAYGLMQLTQDIFEMHLRDLGLQFSNKIALDPIINVECGTREIVRLRRYWLDQGRVDWHTALNSYFWGIRGMWQFEQRKLQPTAPEFFYSRGIMEKSNKWRELIGI